MLDLQVLETTTSELARRTGMPIPVVWDYDDPEDGESLIFGDSVVHASIDHGRYRLDDPSGSVACETFTDDLAAAERIVTRVFEAQQYRATRELGTQSLPATRERLEAFRNMFLTNIHQGRVALADPLLRTLSSVCTRMRSVVEMPDKREQQFIKLVWRNEGVFPAARRDDFAELQDDQLAALEAVVRDAMQLPPLFEHECQAAPKVDTARMPDIKKDLAAALSELERERRDHAWTRKRLDAAQQSNRDRCDTLACRAEQIVRCLDAAVELIEQWNGEQIRRFEFHDGSTFLLGPDWWSFEEHSCLRPSFVQKNKDRARSAVCRVLRGILRVCGGSSV